MTSLLLPPQMPTIEAALKDAGSPHAESRWVAAIALGQSDGPRQSEAFRALLRLLEDPLEEIRAQALEGICEHYRAGAEVETTVIASALKDPAASVRCAAIDAAALILDDPTPEIAPYTCDENASVRVTAAICLGELDATSEIRRIESMIDDPQLVVAQNAALALARLGVSRGTPLLTEMLDGDVDQAVEAAFALGLLGRSETASRLEKTATQLWLPLQLKAMAAAAAARCGSEPGLRLIAQMLQSRRRGKRIIALTTLSRLPLVELAQAIGHVIESKKEIEVSVAIHTLGLLGEVDTSAALIQLEKFSGKLSAELELELRETIGKIETLKL
jgi:HEAT repeat protein